MSIATFWVARKTATLARETLDASTLADIHHQESQSAVVIWSDDRPDRMISFRNDGIHIRGFLANVGFGPASSVSISLQCDKTPRQTGIYLQSLAAGQRIAERPTDSQSVRKDLWHFPLPPGEIWDEFVEQMPAFIITYCTLFDRQRATRYIPGSRTKDEAGVHFLYVQELIELNRDDRTMESPADGSENSR